jgi:hypothetical protein
LSLAEFGRIARDNGLKQGGIEFDILEAGIGVNICYDSALSELSQALK